MQARSREDRPAGQSEVRLAEVVHPNDVDEAILLADRIVMMTNGPAATVGEIVSVPFERPRDRFGIGEDPRYHALRSQLLSFLEERAGHGQSLAAPQQEHRQESTAKITPEDLFIIEKYTGFNRFRSKFRQPRALVEYVTNRQRAEAA
jgi:ABC-type proline/glycine betaine transport system ATPase subunit